MTVTKEIPTALLRELDLHAGDSLRVILERGSTLLVQIEHTAPLQKITPSTKAGDWAREFLGCAALEEGESTDDIRDAHYREKYGI